MHVREQAIMLSRICRLHGATSFVSTWYTFARGIPSTVVLHDMIPVRCFSKVWEWQLTCDAQESLSWDLTLPEWKAKGQALSQYVTRHAVHSRT